MSDLKLQHFSKPSSLQRQGAVPGHARTLHTANKTALAYLGLPANSPIDPKGRVLRHLRIQLNIDPSLLATQACMSLSQLYELEEGGHSRFYSDSLRRQAGRRVAALLGADWDHLTLHEPSQLSSTSNVVQLQRPNSPQPAAAPMPPEFLKIKARQSLDHSPALGASMTSDVNHDSHHGRAISLGLASPATETVLIEPIASTYSAPLVQQADKDSAWSPGWGFLLVTVLGAAAGYAISEYSPYRLVWPW